ncbi:amidohydrolase [Thermococcus profundus]|uniref:Amidohydrolase n=1 Tax=Thermococcus profundus TaxID=49899 RepID=A0A2Z2MBY2_THEPR|nr:amidohydrolase [Thermococcus profundus]ASJ03346.1 amidohydrolase [Thermococcus profundus]
MFALVGTVVDAEKVLRNHAVLVDGKTISAVLSADELRSLGVDRIYGGDGYLVIPGLVNAHTHVAMAKFRGLGDDLPTEKWLEEIIWPMEREWTAEEVGRWALLGTAEALSNGSTVINDHYFFADGIAKAAERVGIRAFVGQTVMDLVDFPLAEPGEGFRFFERWDGRSELVTPTLAPHATNTVSFELMEEIAEFSRDKNALIHIHVAQSREEVRSLRKRYGFGPVEYLKRSGALGGRLVGVHGVYLQGEELREYGMSGATLVHCPTSNVRLEGRTVDLEPFVSAGGNVALANDSPNPVGIMDMFLEMRAASLVGSFLKGGAEPIGSRDIFRWATVGGAKALGIKAGLIKSGYLADLVLINAKKPQFLPGKDPYSHLVHSARGSDVEMVVVGGEIVYRNGIFVKLGLDWSGLMEKF